MSGNLEMFSKNLKKLRKLYDLKQEELARRTKISRSNLSNYELGKTEPTLTPLIQLAKAFYVTIDELIGSNLDDEVLNREKLENTNKFSSVSIFSKNLKELRKSKKLYQIDLAKKIGTAKSNISFYEAGTREPTLTQLMKISDFFKISIDQLVSEEINPLYWIRNESNFLKKLDIDFESIHKNDSKFLNALYELKEYYLNQSIRLSNLLKNEIPSKLKEIDEIIEFVKQKEDDYNK